MTKHRNSSLVLARNFRPKKSNKINALHLGTKTFIRDNRNFDSSEFDSTGVKLYIFIHNKVRDFDKNLTQPEIRVNRVRDNESQLYVPSLVKIH